MRNRVSGFININQGSVNIIGVRFVFYYIVKLRKYSVILCYAACDPIGLGSNTT